MLLVLCKLQSAAAAAAGPRLTLLLKLLPALALLTLRFLTGSVTKNVELLFACQMLR
jgi:hypothetical protein